MSTHETLVSKVPNRLPKFWWIGAGAVLLILLPVMWLGLPPGHDSNNHTVWQREFQAQLSRGDWYPRWLEAANQGLGSTTFYFYPPVPYYIGSLIGLASFGQIDVWHVLGLSMLLCGMASGLTAFAWFRTIVPPNAALAAAVFYALTPYHVVIDLYNRAAYPESLAFVWMPLVMLSIDRVLAGSIRAIGGLGICYGLLVSTHLPTTEMFSVLMLAYAFWRLPRWKWMRGAGVLIGMGLGVGIAAAFLLSVSAEMVNSAMESHRNGFFDYRRWFLFKVWRNAWGDVTARWNWITLLTGVTAIAWMPVLHKTNRRPAAWFFAIVSVAVLFMMSPLSAFIWQIVVPLQAIQFPSRWNTVLTLTASVLVGMGMAVSFEGKWKKIAVALTAGCILFTYLGSAVWLVTRRADISGASKFRQSLDRDIAAGLDPYFFPQWATTMRSMPTTDTANKLAALPKATGVEIRREAPGSPREIRFEVRGGARQTVLFPVFYYPYWNAEVHGKPVAIAPSLPDGLIAVPIETNSENVVLRYTGNPMEKVGEWVTAIAALASLGILLFGPRRSADRESPWEEKLFGPSSHA